MRGEGGLEQVHHQVGVAVGHTEDERLAARGRVQLLGQVVADDFVERPGDDLAIEVLHLQLDLIGRVEEFDLLAASVVKLDLFTYAPCHAVGGELRMNLHRRLVVHKVAIDHGFAVAVGVDGRAEYLGGVQRRRGGKANLDSVEVVKHAAIFGDVILEATKTHLDVREFTVQQIASVTFVDDDAVVLIHSRRHGAIRCVQQALHHALHGGDVHRGVAAWHLLFQLFDTEDVGKGLELFHPRVFERIGSLLAQHGAIDQKKDAPEALRLQQTIDQGNAGLGLARAGGHGQQDRSLTCADAGLGGPDGLLLVGPK